MAQWTETKTCLEAAGVVFVRGLSADELRAAENECGILFPPDLAAFLAEALPIGMGWPNWRSPGHEELTQLQAPFEGMCFDIEKGGFWLDAWGPRPSTKSERRRIARDVVDAAPALIPIVGHRYIPDSPHESGNPVFSVHQMDIIIYGNDLRAFFANHFPAAFGQTGYQYSDGARTIDFWSSVVYGLESD